MAAGDGKADDSRTSGRRRRAERDRLLIESLAYEDSLEAAGREAGVTSRTVSRRLDNPAFAAKVEQRQREIVDERVARLRRLRDARLEAAERAHHVMMELLYDEDPRVRLRAAHELRRDAFQTSDAEFEMRLAEVEQRVRPATSKMESAWAL
jgi:hypothetical protein